MTNEELQLILINFRDDFKIYTPTTINEKIFCSKCHACGRNTCSEYLCTVQHVYVGVLRDGLGRNLDKVLVLDNSENPKIRCNYSGQEWHEPEGRFE